MTYLQPILPALLVLLVAAVYLVRKREKHVPALLWIAVGGLFLFSWPPVEWLFARPLEFAYSPGFPSRSAGAIVVLSGAQQEPDHHFPLGVAGEDTYRRCVYAAWLYQNLEPLPVLVSGSAAPVMRRVLEQEGIPPDRILVEPGSRNTHENAVRSAALLRERRIESVFLVLDARDMPRAAACFRKERIEVVPYVARFHDLSFDLDGLMPSAKTMWGNGATLHEVLGLAWYSVRGWI